MTKSYRKALLWCRTPLIAGALILAFAAPSVAQVTVCIEPADTAIALGDYATVRVTCDGPPADLKGYSVRFTYVPSVLQLGPITPGSVLTGYLYTFLTVPGPPDTVGFDAGVLIGSTMGPGTLGYVQFQGIAPGVSNLVPTQVLMRNSLNQPYAVTLCGGRIRVLPPVPVMPTTWSGIKTRE